MVLKIQWWLLGLVGFCCCAAPAEAGQLSSWQFNTNQNRLEFSTDEGVQPRAQLLSNPARLVIDLPGTTIARSPVNQAVGRAIRQIRISQLDAQTTRIVIELAAGYTLDPQGIQFRGISPMQWTVQLPVPQRVAASASPAAASGAASGTASGAIAPSQSPAPIPASLPAPISSSMTQVENVRVTAGGLFIRTQGPRPNVQISRSRRDRQTIVLTVDNAALSPQLTPEVMIDRYGIGRLEFSQTTPSKVQITLHVVEQSPDWQAAASGDGGIVVLPQGGISAVASLALPTPERPAASERPVAPERPERPAVPERPAASAGTARTSAGTARTSAAQPPARPAPDRASTPASRPAPQRAAASAAPAAPAASAQQATIQSIELNPVNNQLLIRADRPVTSNGRWQSGTYQITLSPAQLAPNVSASDIGGANSPVLRVRLRQQSDQTVLMTIQPAAGVRFGSLNWVSPQLLALELERSPVSTNPATSRASRSGEASRLRSSAAASAISRSRQPTALPGVRNGRMLVVLDPGHGGSDPGAVGINGLQEKRVVLPIAEQVAMYLEQQGVQVILTRTDDRDVELEPRVQMAQQANATVFVSIHANSISLARPDVNGLETYFYSSGEQLAQVIQNSVIQATGMNDRGIRSARFYVLRRTSMPAVLVEVGFVTGSEDAPRLADAGFQNQMARGIAQGILQYLQRGAGQ